MKFPNRVREARIEKGFTRDELAQLAGVTRQSIGLIEAGRVCPSTMVALRISRVLQSSVENLFWENETIIPARLFGNKDGNTNSQTRVYVSSIRNEFVARPVYIETVDSISNPVHGIAQSSTEHKGITEVRLLQSPESISKTVFVSGCDLGLGLLAKYTQRVSSHHQGVWFNASNKRALAELEEGFTHIAAVHYPATGGLEINLPFPYRRYHFAAAELGWILPKGNLKGFHRGEDLTNGHFRLINREAGAGARELLDRELRYFGADPEKIPGYDSVATGHLSVAEAVANGLADVGVGHAGAAAIYGLEFVPIQQESCSLIVPEQYLVTDAVQVFLETLYSDVFRTELGSFGPYDLERMGTVVS